MLRPTSNWKDAWRDGPFSASCISPHPHLHLWRGAALLRWSSWHVPNSPTHDPAVGPWVHLAGEEQSVTPQMVLHGPLQGLLKTQTSPSVPPCSPASKSNSKQLCLGTAPPPTHARAAEGGLPGRLSEPPLRM